MKVSEKNWQRLNSLKKPSESFDNVISRLVGGDYGGGYPDDMFGANPLYGCPDCLMLSWIKRSDSEECPVCGSTKECDRVHVQTRAASEFQNEEKDD